MATQLWMQDNFSKGELSPYMYARASVNQYYDGLKQAQNVLTYPTGAAGKRFGTLFQSILSSSITSYNQIFFQTFQYLDICIFQLVFRPLAIDIYLEGLLVNTVTTTLDQPSVYNLCYTVLGSIFRVAGEGFKPYDLTVALDAGTTITAASSNTLTVGAPTFTVGVVMPVQFTTSNTLPTTVPQVKIGLTYFINASSTTVTALYGTPNDAKFGTNPFTITDNGVGTNKIFLLNTWTFAHCTFKNLPVYDFNGPVTSYDALTFTISATTGAAVGVTISGAGYAPLSAAYIGGAFIGGGGTSRIIGYTNATTFSVSIQTPFDSTNPVQGSLVLLAEPAWSDARGWPQKCSSYQNRALFANSDSLPNGFWASVVNSYPDFGDLTTDDDDAISWYPTSNDVNVIRFIVPFRSITVHTNTGIYSSPLSEIAAITPRTFTLQLQDSTPADVLIPQAIDNQIIVLSGNDVHTMLWDGINNAYTSNIVSIVNEQTIRDPVDEAAYADLRRAGSRYVFIVNFSGSMAVYQTLLSEQVSGFTPQVMEQSYGDAFFTQVSSTSNGRCWFIVERSKATAGSPISITAYTPYVVGPPIVLSTLTAIASNFSTTVPTAITFTTTGTLPASTPAIAVQTYYWAIGVTADTFNVYLSQADALAQVNALQFTSAGTNSHEVPWPLTNIFTLEELSQTIYLDCAVYTNNNGSPSDVATTGVLFNAQDVKAIGDGFGFEAVGVNNTFTFESHGATVAVNESWIGFPINTIMQPMPIAAPPGPNTTLTKPKHIRTARFMFNNTIGGTINGVPIALEPFNEANIGQPPVPARGIFEMSIMQGWDDFNLPTFTIEHNEPFNIELIGVSYSVDI